MSANLYSEWLRQKAGTLGMAAYKGDLLSIANYIETCSRDRQEAISTLRVIGEELVTAGMPAGDRAVTLANVRALVRRFDFRAHLENQRAWSERTFGPGERSAGVVDHIRKELREIEAAPLDLEEWIDVVILALDGAWRAGHSPDDIVAQLVVKQAKNEARQWPDWRTAEPGKAIEHVKVDAARSTQP